MRVANKVVLLVFVGYIGRNCEGFGEEKYVIWAASFDGMNKYHNDGVLALNSTVTYTVAIPTMVSPPMFPSMYGPINLLVSNPGGDSCLVVSTSGGCKFTVCGSNPSGCSEPMPWSTTAPTTYVVTIAKANKSFLAVAEFSVQLDQVCTGGGWIDEYVCIPPIRGIGEVCVGQYNDPVQTYAVTSSVGLGGCNCMTKCGDDHGTGGFCCWDGSTPSNVSRCSNGNADCQDCGGGRCPLAPSDSNSPTPGKPSLSTSLSPSASHSTTPSPFAPAPRPPVTAPGFHLGDLSGPASYAVAAVIGLCSLMIFVGAAWYCYLRGVRSAGTNDLDDNPRAKLNDSGWASVNAD